MLTELIIHNLAVIRHLEVSFGTGLNILSGETGAGKSILVGAVNLILGSRASQDLIRTGANEAAVEAVFHVPAKDALVQYLSDLGQDFTGELVVLRTVSRTGRSRVFVNDQLVTLQQFQPMAKFLASISGQHEHQSLLNPELHLGLLDAFGNLEPLAHQVAKVYEQWSEVAGELARLRRSKKERADQVDWFRFQLQELQAAELQKGEDEALEQEVNVLKHAATLHEAAQDSHQTLYAGRDTILGRFADLERNLHVLVGIDSRQSSLLTHLEQARIHLEELSHCLQSYASSISFEPHRLEAAQERLALLQKLGKKYGGSVAQMIRRRDELRQALTEDGQWDLVENDLRRRKELLEGAYLEKAAALSAQRRETALLLGKAVEDVLALLDMHQASFSVAFEDDKQDKEKESRRFSPAGMDRLQFLLSANPGEGLKPLAKIASGGELSRILLALKSLLSRQGEAETLIFDEVDAGIGGRTAELVGRQLRHLAEKHQVICITHLPQIACYGEYHYRVAKQTHKEETTTSITPLSGEARIEELARMLGGISVSDRTRAQAMEFLQRAHQQSKEPAEPNRT